MKNCLRWCIVLKSFYLLKTKGKIENCSKHLSCFHFSYQNGIMENWAIGMLFSYFSFFEHNAKNEKNGANKYNFFLFSFFLFFGKNEKIEK